MQQLTKGSLLHGGAYKIEHVLGQGSFGITYLATHIALNKKVAIKEFFMKELNGRSEDGSITGMSDGSLSMNYARKFQKEALNLSRLDHPNIVRVTDSFEDNGTFYYVMDYIEGENLNDYVKHNHISQQEALNIIRDVAKALMYMHEEKHMLHLDMKPSNIMRRNSDGHIFIIDFGLSKHYSSNGQPETSTTIGLGTPGYAPIEQANQTKNGEFRPTIDVYALGATFYKLLTRETPPAASEMVSDDELLEENLQNHNIDKNLARIIIKAMSPNVVKRIQTIPAFVDMLNKVKNDATVVDMRPKSFSDVNVDDDNDKTIVGKSNVDSQEKKVKLPHNEQKVNSAGIKFFSKNSYRTFFAIIVFAIIAAIACYHFLGGDSKQVRFCNAERVLEGKVISKDPNYLPTDSLFANDSIYLPADTLSALSVLKELAEDEYGPAMWYMAQFTAYGLAGINKDSVAAVEMYKKAAAQLSKESQNGDMYAQCALSLMYSNGDGVSKDDQLAFNWMKKAAEQGYDDAQNNLAQLYSYGIGVEENDSKAFEWLCKAAKQKHPDAMLALGKAYMNGNGTSPSKEKAYTYFYELACMKYIPAYFQLAEYYYDKSEYAKAKTYFEKASNNSDWRGDFGLGMLYMNGYGVKVNVNTATSYLENAYNAWSVGSSYDDIIIGLYSQLRLADCYYEKKKYTRAFNLYKELADVEEPAAFMKDIVAEAQYMIAVSYFLGNGCKQSFQKAETWRKKALANGYVEKK